MGTNAGSTGPSRLRSFDPVRVADLEYRAWVGYSLRRWPQVRAASVGPVRSYAALLAAVHHEFPR